MLCSVIYTDPEPRSVVSDSRPLFSLPLIAAIRPLFPDHFLFPPKPFRINTYKMVTKQTSLTSFRINTYEKHRGEGVLFLTKNALPLTLALFHPLTFCRE